MRIRTVHSTRSCAASDISWPSRIRRKTPPFPSSASSHSFAIRLPARKMVSRVYSFSRHAESSSLGYRQSGSSGMSFLCGSPINPALDMCIAEDARSRAWPTPPGKQNVLSLRCCLALESRLRSYAAVIADGGIVGLKGQNELNLLRIHFFICGFRRFP